MRLLIIFCIITSIQGETTWHIQSHKPKSSLLNRNFIRFIIDPVNKELKGKLQLKLHSQDPKSSLHQNVSSFSAVRHANIEGMFSASMYWGRIDPVFAVFGDLVAAWEGPEDFIRWFNDAKGERFIQRAYGKYNMHFVGFSISPHESLVSKVPISNVEDLKGRVIRVPPGSMSHDLFRLLGAIPRPTKMSKVAVAFEKNWVEIADYSTIGINLNEGLYKVAKHTNVPGFHSLPVLDFVVNKEKWDALPLKYKTVINKHVLNWRTKNIVALNKEDQKSLKELKKSGVHVYEWSEEERKKVRKIAAKVWRGFSSKSSESKEIVESIHKWLKTNNKL